ncbi:MAG: zinc-ribbon domain-containing protein [Rickettsiaceae bacterium]|nr:zinc-ribbon domain-containing protein [Rickettsiaceae bacterium]
MIISCPKCNSGFFVLPAQIGTTGRRVKCSKCKNIWHATITTDTIPKEDVIAQKPILNNVITGSNLPTIIPVTIPTFLYLLPVMFCFLISGTVWILYPEFSQRIGICGAMCSSKDMRVENVIYEYDKVTNKLKVEYSIVNRSNHKQKSPLVQVKVVDKHDVKLKSIIANPNEQRDIFIPPNKSIKAQAEFTSLSPESKYLEISLGSNMKFLFR